MSLRYLLLLLIVAYVFFVFFVPALRGVFGYSVGTLLALVVGYFVFVDGRGRL
jgi:hypothetical protein